MAEYKYRAFISYSHADRGWGDWLHKALEGYAVPRRLVGRTTAAGTIPKRLAPVFRDRDELPSASDLGGKIEQALAASDSLVVICSPAAAASRWVDQEILAYKRLGRGERIFCLIVDGEPNAGALPGREAEECFPPALRHALDADGNLDPATSVEPIAADARPGGDGKSNARLKLVAGMLGVGLDELKQREQQRRVRRMAAVAALSLLMMLVTSALAVQAVVARKAAERRQQQSEDLIGYMLGDLNDKLKGVGRLDIMQGVADKAMTYFAALPSSDVSDTVLAQRATALQKIGGVRMDQGNTAAALEAYREAVRIEAERLRQSPADVDREIAYADGLKWLGNAYWYEGDLERAGLQFRVAADRLQDAARVRPNDDELAFKLAATRTNSGRVLESRGDYSGASRQYQSVLQIFETLSRQHPGEARWQEELGYAHNNLGKLALEQGDLEQAIVRYRDDRKFKAALAAREPNNQQWRSELAVSDAILAGALALAGETAKATVRASAAVDSGEALVALDPANAFRQDYLALYRIRLASLFRQQNKLDVAKAHAVEALQVLDALAAKDPSNAGWPPDLAKAQLESARVALASGQSTEAGRLIRTALATVKPLLAERSDDRAAVLIATQADCLLGDLAAAQQHAETAQEHWRKARDRIAPLARTSANPELLDAWAGALLRLGEDETAKPLIARLQRMGYRNPDFVALLLREGGAYSPSAAVAQRIAGSLQ